jgi:hypothetical protein
MRILILINLTVFYSGLFISLSQEEAGIQGSILTGVGRTTGERQSSPRRFNRCSRNFHLRGHRDRMTVAERSACSYAGWRPSNIVALGAVFFIKKYYAWYTSGPKTRKLKSVSANSDTSLYKEDGWVYAVMFLCDYDRMDYMCRYLG